LTFIGPDKTQDEREARGLLLIRAAEVLRDVFDAPSLLGRVDRCRFGLIAVGLTETTVEALLNRVASDIQGAAASGGRPPATVRFSVAELDSDTSPEELLGENSDEFAARTHRRTKTVMLAD
jgi:GGDEF domain-containing protein